MKKTVSLLLALAACLCLAVPAMAADNLTGKQLYPAGDWGNGPSLTLSGVTAQRDVDLELTYCYDVAVGGRLVLDMPFPAGMNRTYTIMAAGVGISSDFTDCGDNGQFWDLPVQSRGGMFTEQDGKSQYVYNFTEADLGQVDGFDKAIYMDIYWDESRDPNADYADDSGSVWFYIHVVPAESKPAAIGGFTDVAASSPYAEAIQWAVKQNITSGTSATTFSSDDTCTVAQILTFVWRSQGSPAPAGSASFSNLDSGAYYAKAALWAKEKDLVSGNTFSADIPCTRSMVVEYLWKLAGSPSSGSSGFSDVSGSAGYAEAVAWAVKQGITAGTGATTFSPDATCTRGQIVTFLYRADSK